MLHRGCLLCGIAVTPGPGRSGDAQCSGNLEPPPVRGLCARGSPGVKARTGRRQLKPPRHVVVCGAGVMGASVRYFLALRGVAVTLVERRIDGMKRLASLDEVA